MGRLTTVGQPIVSVRVVAVSRSPGAGANLSNPAAHSLMPPGRIFVSTPQGARPHDVHRNLLPRRAGDPPSRTPPARSAGQRSRLHQVT